MNPDDSDVSRQNKTGRNIDDIHSIDGSLVMTGVTADDDDDREDNDDDDDDDADGDTTTEWRRL